MVKVASCTRCGNVTSAYWGSVPECPKCGSGVREVDVDLGGRERIPRYLNWGGSALLIAVVLLFIATMTDIVSVPVWLLLGMVGACILLLFGSILYQQGLVKESIEKAPQQHGRNRVQRRVRSSTTVRTGPASRDPPSEMGERDPQKRPLPIKRPIAKGRDPERPRKATKIVQGR